MSLRFRLLVAAAVLVTVLAGIGYSLIRTVEDSQTQQVDRQLDLIVPIAIGLSQAPLLPADGSGPFSADGRSGLSNELKLSDMYVAASTTGRSTPSPPPSPPEERPPKPRPAQSLPGAVPRPTTVGSVRGSGRWRAVNLRTRYGRDVLVAIYMGPVDATASELRVAVLAAGGVVAAILLACGFWLERLGLRPIAEMKSVADAIAAGDRTRRITARPRGKEAAHLARALNTMLDKQNEIEDRLLQFVADASHELRTPTSVISGLAQLWRQGDLREGQELEEAMRRVGQESNRMRALVEELLLLARLDSGAHLETQPVDIGRIARDVLAMPPSPTPAGRSTASHRRQRVALGDEAAPAAGHQQSGDERPDPYPGHVHGFRGGERRPGGRHLRRRGHRTRHGCRRGRPSIRAVLAGGAQSYPLRVRAGPLDRPGHRGSSTTAPSTSTARRPWARRSGWSFRCPPAREPRPRAANAPDLPDRMVTAMWAVSVPRRTYPPRPAFRTPPDRRPASFIRVPTAYDAGLVVSKPWSVSSPTPSTVPCPPCC